MSNQINDKLFYVYSCDVEAKVQVKIGTLEGKFDKPKYDDLLNDPSLHECVALSQIPSNRNTNISSTPASRESTPTSQNPTMNVSSTTGGTGAAVTNYCRDLTIDCQVYCDNRPIGLPVSSSYKAFTTRWNWNEWLTLPIHYNELSRDAKLTFTIYDLHSNVERHVVGGTSISLFSKRGLFRQGMYDLKVYPYVVGDGNLTPGKIKSSQSPTTKGNSNEAPMIRQEMDRLSKLSKKHRGGMMEKIDWLDRLTFREIEVINEQEKRNSNSLFLMIEFPYVHQHNIEHLIVYYERNGDDLLYFQSSPTLIRAPDAEIGLENLVEAKHHVLARSARSGPIDRELKPNAVTRDHLAAIVDHSPTSPLTSEEKDLIWKFRYYLSSNKKALAKFLQCVNWDLSNEVKQAVELLHEWTPMDVEDALQLLSPEFTHPTVRKYAVSRLKEAASADDLLLYLLQLVQALKYENFDEIRAGIDTSFVQELTTPSTPSTDMLLPFGDNVVPLYWRSPTESGSSRQDASLFGTTVENESTSTMSRSERQFSGGVDLAEDASTVFRRESIDEGCLDLDRGQGDFEASTRGGGGNVAETSGTDLATFLISSACKDASVANYLYWYLKVEWDCGKVNDDVRKAQKSNQPQNQQQQQQNLEQQRLRQSGLWPSTEQKISSVKDMYLTMLRRLSKALARGGTEAKRRRVQLIAQQNFVDRLVQVMKAVAKESGNRKKKMEFLQNLLTEHDGSINLSILDNLPLPLDPNIKIQSVMAEKASLFNSSLMPCKLYFKTSDNREYVTIFKHGDDLRQDQLVVQMVTLMDKLLRRENLDLRLTPYKVLSTSIDYGFVQYIESLPLRDVLHDYSTVHDFFRYHRPSATGPYGVEPDVIDNYVRSCAGYSVICYLLGIGDRHLHNLLICKSGRLFHIDFGYILGRDPKPLPPPIKLTKEMIDGMGGFGSAHWQEFRNLCYTAFLHLRRHANLILNLFALMVDASIPDIALEPDKTVKKVQERFLLDLSDEEAVQYIQQLIDVSISAKMAAFVDIVHDVAQYLRK